MQVFYTGTEVEIIINNLITQKEKAYLERNKIEEVGHYIYLRSYIDQGIISQEIKIRIVKTSMVLRNLEKKYENYKY